MDKTQSGNRMVAHSLLPVAYSFLSGSAIMLVLFSSCLHSFPTPRAPLSCEHPLPLHLLPRHNCITRFWVLTKVIFRFLFLCLLSLLKSLCFLLSIFSFFIVFLCPCSSSVIGKLYLHSKDKEGELVWGLQLILLRDLPWFYGGHTFSRMWSESSPPLGWLASSGLAYLVCRVLYDL